MTEPTGTSDCIEIGQAFATLVVISKTLGHSSLLTTVRNYLALYDRPRTPAQRFVQDAILNGASAVIPDHMIGEHVASIDLPLLNE